MKTITHQLLGIMFLGTLAAGCGSGSSTQNINPSSPQYLDGDAAPVAFNFKIAQGNQSALTTTDSTGATVDMTQVTATIDRIDIKLPDGVRCTEITFPLPTFAVCDNASTDDSPDDSSDDSSDDDDKIKLMGPFAVNLLTGSSTPSLDEVSLPSGMVKEIKIRMSKLSIVGTVNTQPLNISLNIDEDIEFENLSGFEISEAVAVNTILLSFDVTQWLSGVDMLACATDCSEFEDVIEENVKQSGELSESDDDDSEDDSSLDDDSGSDDDSLDDEDETDDSGQDSPSDLDESDED